VAAAARSLQARVISSDNFARSMAAQEAEDLSDPGTEAERYLKPSEVQAWLDLFTNENHSDGKE
jgi:hypothetical protein